MSGRARSWSQGAGSLVIIPALVIFSLPSVDSQLRCGGSSFVGMHAQSCATFVTPRTVAHHALLPTGFPRQEYWSGLPFPSAGDHPDPGMEPETPALAGRFFLHLVPWPGIKPGPPALEAQSLSLWITREILPPFFFFFLIWLQGPEGLVLGTQLWHAGSSSLTRDWTQAPCTGSRVLAIRPPGKSPHHLLNCLSTQYLDSPYEVLTS